MKPRRWIGGGSESSPVLELRASVQARLGSRSLELLDGARVWGGPPSGNTCHVCERAIVAPEMEYELDSDPPRFLHVMCYTVWLEESRRLTYHQNGPQR